MLASAARSTFQADPAKNPQTNSPPAHVAPAGNDEEKTAHTSSLSTVTVVRTHTEMLKQIVKDNLAALRVESVLTDKSSAEEFKRAFAFITTTYASEMNFTQVETQLSALEQLEKAQPTQLKSKEQLAQELSNAKLVLCTHYQLYQKHEDKDKKNGLVTLTKILVASLRGEAQLSTLHQQINKFRSNPVTQRFIKELTQIIDHSGAAATFAVGHSATPKALQEEAQKSDIYACIIGLAEYFQGGIDTEISQAVDERLVYLKKTLDTAAKDIEDRCRLYLATEPHEEAYKSLKALRGGDGLEYFQRYRVFFKNFVDALPDTSLHKAAELAAKNEYLKTEKRLAFFISTSLLMKAENVKWDLSERLFGELFTQETVRRRPREVVEIFLRPQASQYISVLEGIMTTIREIANSTDVWRGDSDLAYEAMTVFKTAQEAELILDVYNSIKKGSSDRKSVADITRSLQAAYPNEVAAKLQAAKNKGHRSNSPQGAAAAASSLSTQLENQLLPLLNTVGGKKEDRVNTLSRALMTMIPPDQLDERGKELAKARGIQAETIDTLKKSKNPIQGKLIYWVSALSVEFKSDDIRFSLSGLMWREVSTIKRLVIKAKSGAAFKEVGEKCEECKSFIPLIAEKNDPYYDALARFTVGFIEGWYEYHLHEFNFSKEGNKQEIQEKFINVSDKLLNALANFQVFKSPEGIKALKEIDRYNRRTSYLLKQYFLLLCKCYDLFANVLKQTKPVKKTALVAADAAVPLSDRAEDILAEMVSFSQLIIEQDLVTVNFRASEGQLVGQKLGMDVANISVFDIFERCQLLLKVWKQAAEQEVQPEEVPSAEESKDAVDESVDTVRLEQIKAAAEIAEKEFRVGTDAVVRNVVGAISRHYLALESMVAFSGQLLIEAPKATTSTVEEKSGLAPNDERAAPPVLNVLKDIKDLFDKAEPALAVRRDFNAAHQNYQSAIVIAEKAGLPYWVMQARIGLAETCLLEICSLVGKVKFKLEGDGRVTKEQIDEILHKFNEAKACCSEAYKLFRTLQQDKSVNPTLLESANVSYQVISENLHEQCSKFMSRIVALQKENDQTRAAIKVKLGITRFVEMEIVGAVQQAQRAMVPASQAQTAVAPVSQVQHAMALVPQAQLAVVPAPEQKELPKLLKKLRTLGTESLREKRVSTNTNSVISRSQVLTEGLRVMAARHEIPQHVGADIEAKIKEHSEIAWRKGKARHHTTSRKTQFRQNLTKWGEQFSALLKEIKAIHLPEDAKKSAATKKAADHSHLPVSASTSAPLSSSSTSVVSSSPSTSASSSSVSTHSVSTSAAGSFSSSSSSTSSVSSSASWTSVFARPASSNAPTSSSSSSVSTHSASSSSATSSAPISASSSSNTRGKSYIDAFRSGNASVTVGGAGTGASLFTGTSPSAVPNNATPPQTSIGRTPSGSSKVK